MTALQSTRLLISHITLRGPELRQVYEAVAAQGETSYDALVSTLLPAPLGDVEPHALDDALLREALSFLVGAGTLTRRGTGRRSFFKATPLLQRTPLELLLLHHIQCHPDRRQCAIALVQTELVRADILGISPTALRERMERGPYGALFTWTGEKIQFWWHLVAFLGLVHRAPREADILAIPQPALVAAALRWANARTGSTAIDTLLHEIDDQLFACLTARARPSRAMAQTLLTLERQQCLRLMHRSDSARSLLLGERRVSDLVLTEETLL